MRFYDQLVAETGGELEDFLAIPLVRSALAEGVGPDLYRRFLEQAYHHVRHTCPLFERAIARCGASDGILAAGFARYIEEERGHDAWILDDIADLGSDVEAVRAGRPGEACAAMCAHAYRLIDDAGPYSVLGMVHVLEGLSVRLAERIADRIKHRIGDEKARAFRYLTTHGRLDSSHVTFFAELLDAVDSGNVRPIVIGSAQQFYPLYGRIFRDLGGEDKHALRT